VFILSLAFNQCYTRKGSVQFAFLTGNIYLVLPMAAYELLNKGSRFPVILNTVRRTVRAESWEC